MDSNVLKDDSIDWFRRLRPSKILILTLSIAAISSALAVWVTLSDDDNPLVLQYDVISLLVAVNLTLLCVLALFMARRVISLRRYAREEATGSRLQRRIVVIFGLVTIIPTMIVAIFSGVFFHFGIKSWFDERVRTAIEESVAVAEAYLEEHKETIRADVIAMNNDLHRDYYLLTASPANLTQILNAQVALRNLTEAIVFTPNRVVARSELSLSLSFERMPIEPMRRADEGNVVVLADDDDKIRALVKLDALEDIYLMIGRVIDPRVLRHTVVAQGAVNEYRRLQEDISDIQIQFSLLFVLVVLMLLLAAIWYGIYTAMRLVVPISRLISAAEKVRAGDFTARVTVTQKKDEISTLGRTFNRMTDQLQKQREELMHANRQLDERRRFTEAVFAGVSAGVVAMDMHQVITLNNRVAAGLLQDDETQSMKGMPITALLPAIAPLLDEAQSRPDELAEAQLTVMRKQKRLNLQVRVSVELKDKHIEGFIVTFDDITELVSAQRQAAWSDVARRIAHEIKNPLTPIALSAERLKRKYLDNLETDEEKEAFLRYVDTINRHVGDIRQIVEEFVAFARMPSPERKKQDIRKTLKEAMFSSQTAFSSIHHELVVPDKEILLRYDERLIAQVLTNLLKNAAEALEDRAQSDTQKKPEIHIELLQKPDVVDIVIEDNGPGFPEELLSKATEPYVTTKAKGTGLGLAIVKKQMEEHKGKLSLQNVTQGPRQGGAQICLTFPQD